MDNFPEYVTLDLRNITGKPDITMPLCVLEDIAIYSQLLFDPKYSMVSEYIEKISNKLDKVEFPRIKISDYNNPSIASSIILFVSTENDMWEMENLLTAFYHILPYFNDKIPPITKDIFTYGHKNNLNPLRYNSCILYKICKYYGIETNNSTTISQMSSSIRSYSMGIEYLRDQLISSVTNLNMTQLITLYNSTIISSLQSPIMLSSKTINNNKCGDKCTIKRNNTESTYESLNNCAIDLFKISYLLSKVTPTNFDEAIIIAAVRFGINLTESDDPIEQLSHICKNSFNGENDCLYSPIDDDIFYSIYIKNPSWFKIKSTWCYKLCFIYDTDALINFVKNEGYICTSTSNDYLNDIMNISRIKTNIYEGKNPYCDSNTTLIYKECIKNINNSLLLCIGSVADKKMFYVTVEELAEYFLFKKMFVNPLNNDILTKEVINKLKIICECNIISKCEVSFTYDKLLKIILDLENISKLLTQNGKRLAFFITESPQEIKDNIFNFFDSIKKLALYMRGWKLETDNYPLNVIDTNFNLALFGKIEINVTEEFNNLFEIYNLLDNDIKLMLDDLPLIMFRKGDKNIKFFNKKCNKIIFTSPKQKLLNTIKDIKNFDNGNSCIRTNSNWFLMSSVYYMELFGFKNDIDIMLLDDIS